jgi:predicted DNA-binding transcriptional regulator AlpA
LPALQVSSPALLRRKGTLNEVVPLGAPPVSESWLSKAQLAHRLGYSARWVNLRMAEGMPHHKWTGGHVRFRASEVEAWLAERNA